jgi:ribosomal RNA-processing protein 12
MTGLGSIKEVEDSTAAFFYLIALAIKKIPENVLRAKYSEILKALMEPLIKYGGEANNVTLIKSGLMCLCWLLKSQDRRVWQAEETQNAYMFILSFIDHQKPKVRRFVS